jgi:hypothetical protein
MSADQGDKDRAVLAEAAMKFASLYGVPSLSERIMTQDQYAPHDSTLGQDSNRSSAVGLIEALRTLPVRLPQHTIVTLPSAAENLGALVYCSNGGGGSPVVAFSDGTNWRRVDTLAIVS